MNENEMKIENNAEPEKRQRKRTQEARDKSRGKNPRMKSPMITSMRLR